MQEKAKRIRSTDAKASAGLTSTRLLVDIQLYSFSALVGTSAGRRAHILSTSLTSSFRLGKPCCTPPWAQTKGRLPRPVWGHLQRFVSAATIRSAPFRATVIVGAAL
jgi:hypothetical protein